MTCRLCKTGMAWEFEDDHKCEDYPDRPWDGIRKRSARCLKCENPIRRDSKDDLCKECTQRVIDAEIYELREYLRGKNE